MEKIVILISCILMFNTAFSQEKTKEYLMAKSRRQKTIAWVLIGTGTAAIITGVLIEAPHRGTDNSQSYTGGLAEIGGVIFTLTSIPFFINSFKNKKRAAVLTMNCQKILLPSNGAFIAKTRPALALRIEL